MVKDDAKTTGMPASQNQTQRLIKMSAQRREKTASRTYQPCLAIKTSAVKLAPLNVNTVLPNRHAQILHRKHRPVLAPALATTAVARSLDAQGPSLVLVLGRRARGAARLAGDGEAGGGAEVAHGVVGARVGPADARVLVRVGGDVGDELLCREGEEARETRVRLRGRREPGLGHVVVCHSVGDLRGGAVPVSFESLSGMEASSVKVCVESRAPFPSDRSDGCSMKMASSQLWRGQLTIGA